MYNLLSDADLRALSCVLMILSNSQRTNRVSRRSDSSRVYLVNGTDISAGLSMRWAQIKGFRRKQLSEFCWIHFVLLELSGWRHML